MRAPRNQSLPVPGSACPGIIMACVLGVALSSGALAEERSIEISSPEKEKIGGFEFLAHPDSVEVESDDAGFQVFARIGGAYPKPGANLILGTEPMQLDRHGKFLARV